MTAPICRFHTLRFLLPQMVACASIPNLLSAADAEKSDLSPVLHTGPVPAWVEPVPWSLPTEPAAAGIAAEILLSDGQDRLTTRGRDYFFREIVRLLSAEGVRQHAEQSKEISPEYEAITWHTLKIYRNGAAIDRLPATQFKKLQRELGLETQMLTGQISVVAVLEDVRVGDVLETAFTKHDQNPLLMGHVSARHYLGAAYPIRHERVVVRMPAAGPRAAWSFVVPAGTHDLPEAIFRPGMLRLAVEDQTEGEERILRWEARALPAISFEEAIPARAYPYWPMFRVSSFRTWADVAEWAGPLFAAGQPLPDTVGALVEKWRRDLPPSERLAAAVHWVQDDLRYFALAIGEHNLRPRALADICTTRFGDCKDKSLLLAVMLRALGFEAWPALVNTYWRDQLREVSPHPYAFNHAIVAYRDRGQLRWVDPTLRNQQGPPGEWAVPRYRTALIVRPDEAALTDIVAPGLPEPDTVTRERIVIDPASGDATVTTEVTIRDLQADFFREQLAMVSAGEQSKRWFNFVGRFYRQLEELEAPVASDDRATNQIVLRMRYRLPGFLHPERGETVAGIYAYTLRAILDQPASRRRHWPYALASDRFVRHRIEVELPFDMPFEQQPEAIRTDGLEYRIERGLAGRRFVVQHDLRVTGDSVAAERMGRFCNAVDEILTGLGTTLRKPAPAANATQKVNAAAPAK